MGICGLLTLKQCFGKGRYWGVEIDEVTSLGRSAAQNLIPMWRGNSAVEVLIQTAFHLGPGFDTQILKSIPKREGGQSCSNFRLQSSRVDRFCVDQVVVDA